MANKTIRRAYRKEDVDEFDRKLRGFRESLAHKERRMLREIITAALDEENEDSDLEGYAQLDDDALFRALAAALTKE